MIGWVGTNSLAEGRNGRGLVVLDVEEVRVAGIGPCKRCVVAYRR
jgi:uncharacterized protein YcbX